jgi:hypothetical protein
VYIDVSGSCDGFIPALLRGALSCSDLKPRFWQFSTEVVPVTAQQLAAGKVASSGGTWGAAVTEHLKEIASPAAVIITDGYVGRVPEDHLEACARARLQVVLTPGGMRRHLEPAAAAFHQLESVQ